MRRRNKKTPGPLQGLWVGGGDFTVNNSPNKAFCSWSGGKDCALALHKAVESGATIARLVNMITEDKSHSRTHGISAALLTLQAQAIGIPLIQRPATWDTYEREFKNVLLEMPQAGIDHGIFGDIDLEEHRAWVTRVCSECSITASLPLWNWKREDILARFLRSGFKAVIVAVDKRWLDQTWVGREIDETFVNDIRQCPDVDLCGEKGEYHTFVYDGPVFNIPVTFEKGGIRSDGDYFFLDIKNPALKE